MPLLANLQSFGNLEGNEWVVGLAARQAGLADDCQGQQKVALRRLLCNVSWRQHDRKSAEHMYSSVGLKLMCITGSIPCRISEIFYRLAALHRCGASQLWWMDLTAHVKLPSRFSQYMGCHSCLIHHCNPPVPSEIKHKLHQMQQLQGVHAVQPNT